MAAFNIVHPSNLCKITSLNNSLKMCRERLITGKLRYTNSSSKSMGVSYGNNIRNDLPSEGNTT